MLNAPFCLKKRKLRKNESEVFRVKILQHKVTKCNIYKNSLFVIIVFWQFSRKFYYSGCLSHSTNQLKNNGQSPLSHRQKYGFHLEPKDRKPEILYRLKCDVGASKNAGQAFSTPRLSSHFSLYNISGFRFLSPSIRIFEDTFSFP